LKVFCVALLAVGCGKTTAGPANGQPGSQAAGGQSEPKFKGKAVSVWAQQLSDKDVTTRVEAANALKALGAEAKAAVPSLKVALKERAWELLIAQGGRNVNRTFTAVGTRIGSTTPRQPTKDEIITNLRRELEEKKRDIAALEKQQEEMFNDACLNALVTALLAIDQRELQAMVPGAAVQSTKTFGAVSDKIGSTKPK
jgi:hypothetical protein